MQYISPAPIGLLAGFNLYGYYFLCKGATFGAYPSGTSRDISLIIATYDHKIGKQSIRKNPVNIFDFENKDVDF